MVRKLRSCMLQGAVKEKEMKKVRCTACNFPQSWGQLHCPLVEAAGSMWSSLVYKIGIKCLLHKLIEQKQIFRPVTDNKKGLIIVSQ